MKNEEIKNMKWEYKIGGSFHGFIPIFIVLAVFGGISIWLHKSNNGAYIFADFLTAVVLACLVYSIYRVIFVKVLIGKEGFYYQSKPGNGRYYKYSEISEAWESSGRTQNGANNYYCSFRTADGNVMKFWYQHFESDGVDYFLTSINGEESEAESEDSYE